MTVTVGAHHCCFTGAIGDPIAKYLMQCLWQRVLRLLTRIRRIMKNSLLPLLDKLLLRKRSIIETLFAKGKSGKPQSAFTEDSHSSLNLNSG